MRPAYKYCSCIDDMQLSNVAIRNSYRNRSRARKILYMPGVLMQDAALASSPSQQCPFPLDEVQIGRELRGLCSSG